jgi:MarR family transcriptional regulator, organic hydroperoxide resistance regulator
VASRNSTVGRAREAFPLLEHHLCFALYRASRAMIRAYGPLLEPLGLTYPQYLTLLALWEASSADPLSVKELGTRLSLDSATLTPLLKRLERSAVIERRRDTKDERVVRVHLTKKGRALQAKARHVPVQLACRVADVHDRATLARLTRLREELRDIAYQLEKSA